MSLSKGPGSKSSPTNNDVSGEESTDPYMSTEDEDMYSDEDLTNPFKNISRSGKTRGSKATPVQVEEDPGAGEPNPISVVKKRIPRSKNQSSGVGVDGSSKKALVKDETSSVVKDQTSDEEGDVEGEFEKVEGGVGGVENDPVRSLTNTGQKRIRRKKGKRGGYRPGSGRPEKYDWGPIREAYINGISVSEEDPNDLRWPTMKELHLQYNVPYNTIREKAAKEGWTDQRDEYMVKNVALIQKARQKHMVKKSMVFDENSLKMAEIGASLVITRLAEVARDVEKFKDIREKLREKQLQGQMLTPQENKLIRSPIWSKELVDLAMAGERFQNIGMRALGTDIQRMDISASLEQQVDIEETVKIDITNEIKRDDPDRVAGLVAAFADAGLFPDGMVEMLIESGDEDIEDAVIVEDETTAPQENDEGAGK